VLLSAPRDVGDSVVWRLLRRFYLVLMLFSFTEEMSCVFISTVAMMMLQSGNVQPFAASLVEMLVRELEYEYVSVRHHFITGVLSLMAAQALRVRQALRFQPALARAAMFGILSSAFSLLTFSNARAITYGGYMGMAQRFIVLHTQLIVSYSTLGHPLALLGLASTVAALYYAWQATHEPIHVAPEKMSNLGWGIGRFIDRRSQERSGMARATSRAAEPPSIMAATGVGDVAPPTAYSDATLWELAKQLMAHLELPSSLNTLDAVADASDAQLDSTLPPTATAGERILAAHTAVFGNEDNHE